MQKITVNVVVNSDIQNTWDKWVSPEAIKVWCHASPDWAVGDVQNDVRVDGRFLTNMHSVDNTQSFDFTGTYVEVIPMEKLVYKMDKLESEAEHRMCEVMFEKISDTETKVSETFDMESLNSEDAQRAGWQAILDNFKKFVEGN